MRLGLAEGRVRVHEVLSGRTYSDDPVSYNRSWAEKKRRERKDKLKEFRPLPELKPVEIPIISRAEFEEIDPWSGETVFIDFETTGLDENKDRIVEIAIVDESGKVLMNTLVNPQIPIPPKLTKDVHGISDEMVASAPTLKELELELIRIIGEKRMVAYNVKFEMDFMPPQVKIWIGKDECCMKRFSRYFHNFTNRNKRASVRIVRRRLIDAAKFIGHEWQGDPHRALADAIATRAVWNFIDEQEKRTTQQADAS
jgi:DNA polymerase III epsilon subunit-like protein